MSLTYAELVRTLFPRITGGVRWGLERTTALLAQVDNPHTKFRTIHVAGTNGKGSVAATLASILRHAGWRTGLYTSPHLCSFRERIRIDGEPISEEELMRAATPLLESIRESEASFFEATTAIAFHAFSLVPVDVAVIEVGLGGRLDSTNVITPELSIITNIAFDHAEYLGTTLESIAGEKAGIIKPGVPVITAEPDYAALKVFTEKAQSMNAPFSQAPRPKINELSRRGVRMQVPTATWGNVEISTRLIGRHQAQNVVLAVAAADLLADSFKIERSALANGVLAVRWPGRFQVERRADRLWVFDVAHNEAGVHALAATFKSVRFPKPVAILVGILGDKEWERMLPPLFGVAQHVVLTIPPTAPPDRAWDPAEALRRVPNPAAEVVLDFTAALARVQALAGSGGTVFVTGSFHTVGDALGILGWCTTAPDFPLPHNGFSG